MPRQIESEGQMKPGPITSPTANEYFHRTAGQAEGIPVEVLRGGFVQPIRPGEQTCPCTAVHYPCPYNLYE